MISVPTAFLLRYAKKVPFYVTENDVKEYLAGEFQSVLKLKRGDLCSQGIKNKVKEISENLKDNKLSIEQASDMLNEHILNIIFIGDKNQSSCKKCANKAKCPNKKCHAKKGLGTKFEVANPDS